jgi:putative endonuclease
MTTTGRGQRAEQVAAEYLTRLGFIVVARNWNVPKLCEIDVIAIHEKRVHFIEVKYRMSNHAGSGLDYITPVKLRHMRRAAAIWVRQNNFRGSYDISAVEVSGPDFVVGEFIETIF